MTIRKINREDRESYLYLVEKFYQTDGVMAPIEREYMEKTFEELVTRDTYAVCFLAEEDGKAAGYTLLAKTFSQEGGGETVWIEELYVLPEYRGRGIASKLLETVFAEYKVKRYRLEVEPDNVHAVKLYGKYNFYFIPYQEMVKTK